MKLIQFKNVLLLAVIMVAGIGCNSSSSQDNEDERSVAQASTEEKETESGIRYQFIRHGSGEQPTDGGYWTMNVKYVDENGETIFSSADNGGPMPLNHSTTNFRENASIEECMTLIGAGDSAVFYINADSLYKNSANRPTPPELVGTTIKLNIGIDQVFTTEEFVAYKEELKKKQLAKEVATIQAYLDEKGIVAETTEEGLYYTITKNGNGVKPKVGQKVKVNYTGSLLDGTVFDTSIEADAKEANVFTPNRQYQPFEFSLGTGGVIQGWDIGIAKLSEGSKATLIVPSVLGYGERGAGPTIKPNSILVFTVELVEIVD
jgi:FKBP-type peptidyl-prolyl cis-trans isomerase FkpA